jgi:hypothetical protein
MYPKDHMDTTWKESVERGVGQQGCKERMPRIIERQTDYSARVHCQMTAPLMKVKSV